MSGLDPYTVALLLSLGVFIYCASVLILSKQRRDALGLHMIGAVVAFAALVITLNAPELIRGPGH